MTGPALAVALALAWSAPRSSRRPEIDIKLVVDVNTAPGGVLLALPRLGPVLVGRIVAEREREPFHSLEDVDARVRGIGPATVAALRPHLRFVSEEPAGAPRLEPTPLASRAR
jgi:competence protein ComEA